MVRKVAKKHYKQGNCRNAHFIAKLDERSFPCLFFMVLEQINKDGEVGL